LSIQNSFDSASGGALFSAICAIVIASCIDFAIFEPAVMMTFWLTVAILAAITNAKTEKPPVTLQLTVPKRILIASVSVMAIWAYCSFSLIPTINSSQKIQHAMRDYLIAGQLLTAASQDDPLDPAPLNMCGKTYLTQYKQTGRSQPELLTKAAECFTKAAELDNADFKYYEKLTEVHKLLAEAALEPKGHDTHKAYEYAIEAVKRYPGSARLHIELALFAERLEKIDLAIEHYAIAVRIEDEYREMFKLMYPDRKVVSRLAMGNYGFAKERIGQLTGQAD
jgi:tetratricopeptide (TPR) repeat protein